MNTTANHPQIVALTNEHAAAREVELSGKAWADTTEARLAHTRLRLDAPTATHIIGALDDSESEDGDWYFRVDKAVDADGETITGHNLSYLPEQTLWAHGRTLNGGEPNHDSLAIIAITDLDPNQAANGIDQDAPAAITQECAWFESLGNTGSDGFIQQAATIAAAMRDSDDYPTRYPVTVQAQSDDDIPHHLNLGILVSDGRGATLTVSRNLGAQECTTDTSLDGPAQAIATFTALDREVRDLMDAASRYGMQAPR